MPPRRRCQEAVVSPTRDDGSEEDQPRKTVLARQSVRKKEGTMIQGLAFSVGEGVILAVLVLLVVAVLKGK